MLVVEVDVIFVEIDFVDVQLLGGWFVVVVGRQVEILIGVVVGQVQEFGVWLGQFDLWNVDGLLE